jgi:hypothetical protein
MSELTHAEARRADILDIQRWVRVRDDTIHLLDPATAEPLNLDQPPVWLASDPRLAEGYQALGNPAYNHELIIALGRHKLASDLGRFQNRFAWFERTYAKSHASAIEEAEGWGRATWEDVLQRLRSLEQLPPQLLHPEVFTDRALRATIRHPHVAEFPYDIEKTGKPIDTLLLEMTNPEAEDSRLQDIEFGIRKVLQFAASALREWYIPGKYMHELLKLDLPGHPRVLFTIGAAHGDIPRKFDALGFVPKVRKLPLSKENEQKVKTYTQAMRTGHIGLQALGGLSLK